MDDAQADRPPLNLRERAYASFTRHLLARDIRAGQFISQRELVELTGLPLGAIRELVPRLEAEGLVQTVPQRGMQVAHVDLALIKDAFQYRLFLEREAVAVFTVEASPAVVGRLRAAHDDVLARLEAALAADAMTPELMAEAQALDWDLHATIVDALGNRIISDAYRVNAIKIRLIRQEQTQLNDAVVLPTMREHLDIIAGIEKRDPAAASEAMAAHIVSARKRATGIG
jgi:DNA-binding GntR family transcriptional regulator